MAKPGRKKLEIDPAKLRELSARMVKQEHITMCPGTSVTTFSECLKEDPKLAENVTDGRAELADKSLYEIW